MYITTTLRHYVSFVLLTIIIIPVHAQTYFSGGIYSHTIWTVAESPYIITDDVTVFPGASLTIEPGVDMKFDDDVIMTVRSADFIATGTATDSIRFISNSLTPVSDSWQGLVLEDSTFCSVAYCRFSNAIKGINGNELAWSDSDSKVIVSNSVFTNNLNGIDIEVTHAWLHVKNSRFENNVNFGITNIGTYPEGKNTLIENCFFINNDHGIGSGGFMNIYNSVFCGNEYWGVFGADTLANCTFINNTGTALQGSVHFAWGNIFTGNEVAASPNITIGFGDTSCLFTDNYFYDNEVGIEISGSSGDVIDLSGNYTCGNETDLTTTSENNFSVINLCFCESDSLTIAGKVKDGYDDVSLGLITFSPFASCDASVFDTLSVASCESIGTGIPNNNVNNIGSLQVFPNPAENSLTVVLPSGEHSWTITIRNIVGQIQLSTETVLPQTILDISKLPAGTYFISAYTVNQVYTGNVLKVKY